MRKALASIAVIAFAGLLCASLLAAFNGYVLGSHLLDSKTFEHAYFMAY